MAYFLSALLCFLCRPLKPSTYKANDLKSFGKILPKYTSKINSVMITMEHFFEIHKYIKIS